MTSLILMMNLWAAGAVDLAGTPRTGNTPGAFEPIGGVVVVPDPDPEAPSAPSAPIGLVIEVTEVPLNE